jgi:hypothetical protein
MSDEAIKRIWRALAEGRIDDEAAQAAAEEAAHARRARRQGNDPAEPSRPPAGRLRASVRREKMFGAGRPRALDRNAKVRIMHWARCLSRRTEKGKAYGVVTAKALAVLESLLWAFHNGKSGLCFPSYERIAEAAGCARSTVAESIRALEASGLISWVHRIKRVRVRCPDLFGPDGWRLAPQRTSNAYHFNDPSGASGAASKSDAPYKSEKPTGTANQGFFSSIKGADRNSKTTSKAFGMI